MASKLLDDRLAACVQLVGPVTSRYWWEGKQERAEEWLCLAKSAVRLVPQIVESVRSVHSYDVPEILALPVVAGSTEYLAWLEGELA